MVEKGQHVQITLRVKPETWALIEELSAKTGVKTAAISGVILDSFTPANDTDRNVLLMLAGDRIRKLKADFRSRLKAVSR